MKKTIIIGAGITGLILAYELCKRGCSVTVIEKDGCAGGLAKPLIWHGIPIDLGPRIYHTPDREVLNYWKKEFAGLFFEREHWSKNFQNGKYFDYPISYEFINKLPTELKNKIKEELKNRNEEQLRSAKNYFEYTNALAGDTLQEMFFIRYPEKVWGISTHRLDTNWAPKRVEIRKKTTPFYWGQWSAVGINGSGTITSRLYKNLQQLGCPVFLNEEAKKIQIVNNSIDAIITDKRKIILEQEDAVINTASCTIISKLIGKKTKLQYRGVILVYLFLKKKANFPKGIDFIYFDSPQISFHRVSDQCQFMKNPPQDKHVYIFEIAYSKNDKNDKKNEKKLIAEVIAQFASLGFIKKSDVLDSKLIKAPEVYPMFFLGYKEELAKTKADIAGIRNLYNIGSLAEYNYSDLQILFSKAIDFAELLTERTLKMNKVEKTTPRLSFQKEISIKNKIIGEGRPTFIIAEIGLNHNGDMRLAKRLIDTAVESGVDAVKFQSYKTANRVAEKGKTARYAEKILGMEETDYEMLKKCELSFAIMQELFRYAKNKTTIFSTPFDTHSVDELEKLNVCCYKVASFDLTNIGLLQKIAETGKPMIISTGMSGLAEVEEALKSIILKGNNKVALLHCLSSYPCLAENMNIKAIDTLKTAFGVPVGLSDHSSNEIISLAAVARGANLIEKHFTLDKNMEGPDHAFSLTPQEFKGMVERIRIIEAALGDGIKQVSADEFSTIVRFRKTMYAGRNIKSGEKIREKDIVLKGPAYGIYPKFMDIVIEQRAIIDIEKDAPITWEKIGHV